MPEITMHIAREIANAARAAGYQVGIAFRPASKGHTGWAARLPWQTYGNQVAVSIYRDGSEVARLAWSRVRPGYSHHVLGFAGLRIGDEFVDQGAVRHIAQALGMDDFARDLPGTTKALDRRRIAVDTEGE